MTIRAEFVAPPEAAQAQPAAQPQNAAGGEGEPDKLVPDFKVKLNGQPLSDALRECLYTIEVQQSLTLVSMAVLVFDNPGAIVSDAGEVGSGVEVEIELGYLGSLSPVFKGEVISIEPNFPQGGNPYCLIRAYDKLHRMRRGTKQRTFLEQKVSDIVTSIAGEEGLTPEVEDTQVTAPYILQSNQSNVDFLHELSKRYHCEITVDGPNKKLKLKRPSTTGQQSKSLKWGESLKSFYVKMSLANVPTKVEVKTWDPGTKSIKTATATESHGAMDTKPSIIEQAKKAFGEAKRTISIRPASDPKEAKAMAESALNDAAMDSVKGTAAAQGDPEITPGMIILLEGLGAVWTGQYYVTGATHLLARSSGYTTSFDVKRPGTGNTPIQEQVEPTPPAEEEEEEEEEESGKLSSTVTVAPSEEQDEEPAAEEEEEEEAEPAPAPEPEPEPEPEAAEETGPAESEGAGPAIPEDDHSPPPEGYRPGSPRERS